MLLDQFHVGYLTNFYKYKNRNVAKAAKSLINLYRDINPKMLEKRYRGKVRINKDEN